MPTSPGFDAQQEDRKEAEQKFQPPDNWVDMVNYHRQRLSLAKQARNTPDRKFDNLTFIQDFYSNEDAVNSYLRPKRNDDEVRVVGGTTEKRVESVVNELMGMNYQHEIQAFDVTDAVIVGLGKAMEDAVTRSNQIEHDEETCADAIWELCTQRAVFVEELIEERRSGQFYIKQCRKRVRSAIEVILGDQTMPAYLLQEQPFIATYDRMSKRTARMFFGHYDNFKYVRGGMDLSVDVYGSEVTFRLGILQQDEVEVIRYSSVPDNEYQIYINGVPMLKPGTPLPFQYPFPRYNLSVGVPKRMGHHTFYGRSMASAMKYLQALSDETVRNIVRKFRQAIEPPRAIKSQERIVTRDIYNAGKVSYGVDADSIKPLTNHNGVTDAETTVMNMIKQMQDELAARSAVDLGAQPGKKQSATAIVEQQKQAVKMLGQLVLAWTGLVRQMTENRTYTIIETMSEPDGMRYDPVADQLIEEFRRFTLANQPLENGKSGTRIVQFVGKDLTDQQHESIDDWEQDQDAAGNPARLSVVNVKKLRNMSINWYVTVSSHPKDSDDLHKLMFEDKFSQASAIGQAVGRQLNAERVVDEFEQTWRAKDWFAEVQPGAPGQQGADQGQQPADQGGGAPPAAPGGPAAPTPPGSGLGGDLTNGIRAGTKRPPMPAQKPKELVGAA